MTATDKQVSYIASLLDERDLFKSPTFFDAVNAMDEGELAAYIARLKEQVKTVSKQRASEIIGTLIELPRKPEANRSTGVTEFKEIANKVPAGRYAVTGEDGTTDFYKVDKPTEGKWAGYTFVKLGLGGGYGEPNWERVSFKNTSAVLHKIVAAGPEEASKRYGKELGHCGCCGRTLTNPDSIERGIGPVCAAKNAWTF